MANLCNYDLYATGTKENLEKFKLMMEWEEKPAVNSSMYCADMLSEEPTDNGDGTFTQHFSSATRWSVQHGMIDREDSDECVSLTTAARMLSLSMEIWSEEPGCCFAEHIEISEDGGYSIECEDYYEIYAEGLAEQLGKDEENITADDLRSHLEGFVDQDVLEGLDIDEVLSRLKENGTVSIGGFEQNSDFPFSAIVECREAQESGTPSIVERMVDERLATSKLTGGELEEVRKDAISRLANKLEAASLKNLADIELAGDMAVMEALQKREIRENIRRSLKRYLSRIGCQEACGETVEGITEGIIKQKPSSEILGLICRYHAMDGTSSLEEKTAEYVFSLYAHGYATIRANPEEDKR